MGGGGALAKQEEGAATGGFKLVGHKNFVRQNPLSDKFAVHKFHHVEFYCADATNTYNRFAWGLGMQLVSKSDHSTGNAQFASYVLRSNDLVFAFTAPYSRKMAAEQRATAEAAASYVGEQQQQGGGSSLFPSSSQPWYSLDTAYEFVNSHGLGVRAVGLVVDDARVAYDTAVANGAVGVTKPTELRAPAADGGAAVNGGGSTQVVSEVKVYGDVVMRFVSGDYQGPFLASYTPVDSYPLCYGLQRLDHAVGNVHNLLEAANYIAGFTGFHEFAEFTAEDVGTVDSGLNSMVLSNNNEHVLMPINEPTFGTRRKSQIQTYLEQNEGPGLQHLALKTDDIISTLREMRQRSACGGFEFMPRARDEYYKKLPEKIGDALTQQQYKDIQELGILADKDDQGVLLQIFTRPLGDRPTVFLEIIQRVGCMRPVPGDEAGRQEQAAGCGGFGKGNFSELFRSIEDYEKTLQV